MRLARTAALALIGAAILAAPASAFETGSWMPAADLSVLGFHYAPPQVTVAPDGTLIAIWGRSDGGNTVIQAATRAPGGTLSDPIDLSDPARTAMFPRVAIAADGTATAVWSIADGADVVIEASTRPPGGSFGPAVTVGAAQFLASPQVAVAADGATTVAWSAGPGPGSPRVVRAATRAPGSSFGEPVELSAAGQDASSPQLVVAANGTTTVIWNRSDGTNQIAQARTRPPGGPFGATDDLSAPGANAEVTDAALAPDGTTTAIWTRGGLVQAATRPPAGEFGDPAETISRVGETAMEPRAAVAGDGTTTVVWRASNVDSDTNVQAATRPAGGAFAPAVDLIAPVPHGGPPAALVYSPRVAASADGTTTAIWTHPDGTANRVRASTRLPGGGFGTPAYLSTAGLNAFDPQVGTAADGFATVVWSLSDGISRNQVQATFTADAPIGRGALAITGTPALGSTLGCDGGRWIGATSVETGWLRGDLDVATGASYVVTTADEGAALTCRGRATNALGTTSRVSSPISIPAAVPPPAPPAPPAPPVMPPPAAAPPADIAAPAVTVLTKARLTRRQFLSGVSVRLSANEPATIVAELRGRASRSRTTGPYTRPLGSRKLFGVTKAITVKIKPRPAAVGRARSFSVRLRLIVTDVLGNKRITGKTIRVTG